MSSPFPSEDYPRAEPGLEPFSTLPVAVQLAQASHRYVGRLEATAYLLIQALIVGLVWWYAGMLAWPVVGLMLLGNATLMRSLLRRAGHQVSGKRHRKVLTKAILRSLTERIVGFSATDQQLDELRIDVLRLISHCLADGLGVAPAACTASIWNGDGERILSTVRSHIPPLAEELRAAAGTQRSSVCVQDATDATVLGLPLDMGDGHTPWAVCITIGGRALDLSDQERALWQTTLWPYTELLALTLVPPHVEELIDTEGGR